MDKSLNSSVFLSQVILFASSLKIVIKLVRKAFMQINFPITFNAIIKKKCRRDIRKECAQSALINFNF